MCTFNIRRDIPKWANPSPLPHMEKMSLVWPDTRTSIGATVWSGLSVLGDNWRYASYLLIESCQWTVPLIINKILYRSMSVDSFPDLDKILYRSMSVDSSLDFLIFEKMAMSSHNGKYFPNRSFRFKIRFGPFWIDSDQNKNRHRRLLSELRISALPYSTYFRS